MATAQTILRATPQELWASFQALSEYRQQSPILPGRYSKRVNDNSTSHKQPTAQCDTSNLARAIYDLPNEVLIHLFSYLDGDISVFRNLALTCRRFRDLLKGDENHIAFAIGKRTRGFERIILENTTVSNHPHTYKWLWNAYDRGRRLRALVDMFEASGAFGNDGIFLRGCLRANEVTHARRMLSTMFLAAELCACIPTFAEKFAWIQKEELGRVNDFLRNIYHIGLYIIGKACLFVNEADTVMTGDGTRSWLANPFFRAVQVRQHHTRLADFLAEGILLRGPGALLGLLGRRYETFDHFERMVRTKLYFWHANVYPTRVYLTTHPTWRWSTLSRTAMVLSMTRQVQMAHKDDLGIFKLSFTEWSLTVKDDQDWETLMKKLKWSKPIQRFRA